MENEGQSATEANAPPSNREDTRYPLANDANGNPIAVPPSAVAWRIRRGGGRRGRPRNVFDSETGRQLEIALGAGLDDLIACHVPADRYLLYPIDAQGQIIPGMVAVTEVSATDEDDDDTDGDEKKARNEGLDPNSRDPLVALCAQQQELIKTLIAENTRALGSAVSGYGPVRAPTLPPPAPIIVEHPQAAPPPDGGGSLVDKLTNMKPEQMMQIAFVVKQVFDAIKGGFAPASAAPVGGAVGGVT